MAVTRRAVLAGGAGAAATLALGACSGPSGPSIPASTPTTTPTSATPSPSTLPKLAVERAAGGLEHPWGLGFVDGGAVLFNERPGRLRLLRAGQLSEVTADLDDVQATGEGGLTGLAVSPGFARDRRIVLCFNSTEGDVRVVPFTLSADLRSATRLPPLVTGLPANPSGRHSGCRPLFGPDGKLWIGTGDAAQGTNPQDLTSLGGKVLRVEPLTGQAPGDNPWADAANPRQRLVWSLGHRNVQGITVQPGTRSVYVVEHGSDVDDEVNLIARGSNHGWNPVGQGSYDESRPMTDTSIPGAVAAVWSSGDPTVATSGGDFATGAAWGGWSGRLLVACLKAQEMLALPISRGRLTGEVVHVPEFQGTHGRLRTVQRAPDGALWVTTSNGSDDELLRVTPA